MFDEAKKKALGINDKIDNKVDGKIDQAQKSRFSWLMFGGAALVILVIGLFLAIH